MGSHDVSVFICIGAAACSMSNSSVNSLTKKSVCSSILSLVRFTHSELVVDFVDVFVDAFVVKQPMEEVVPGVLDDSAAEALGQEVRPRGEDNKKTGLKPFLTQFLKDQCVGFSGNYQQDCSRSI